MSKNKKILEAPKKLKILFTIVNRNKADFYLDVLESFDINLQTIIYGSSFFMELIDIKKSHDYDSAVIISVVEESKIPAILSSYEDKYFKTRNGKGYGFTVPMDSIIGVMAYKFLANVEV